MFTFKVWFSRIISISSPVLITLKSMADRLSSSSHWLSGFLDPFLNRLFLVSKNGDWNCYVKYQVKEEEKDDSVDYGILE